MRLMGFPGTTSATAQLPFYCHSPLGLVTIFYNADPFFLATVVLPKSGRRNELTGDPYFSCRPEGPCAFRVEQFFRAYFNRQTLPVPWDLLCLDGFTPLERRVWEKTSEIPMGCVSTYGQVAVAIGRGKAARFVGNALGKNPFPIVIPCHRVIPKGGGFGGFGSGIEMKRELIAFEGVPDKPVLA